MFKSRWVTLMGFLLVAMTACDRSGPAPAIDFTLSPASATLMQGGEPRSITVSIARTGGFTGAVSFALVGLPEGVDASISGGGAAESNATIVLTPGASAVVGAHTVTVRATGAGLGTPVDRDLNLEIQAASIPGFDFTLSPSSITMVQGGRSRDIDLDITRTHGFSGDIDLQVLGLPFDYSVDVYVDEANEPVAINLWVDSAAATGAHTVTVRATGAGLTSAPVEHDLTLEVLPITDFAGPDVFSFVNTTVGYTGPNVDGVQVFVAFVSDDDLGSFGIVGESSLEDGILTVDLPTPIDSLALGPSEWFGLVSTDSNLGITGFMDISDYEIDGWFILSNAQGAEMFEDFDVGPLLGASQGMLLYADRPATLTLDADYFGAAASTGSVGLVQGWNFIIVSVTEVEAGAFSLELSLGDTDDPELDWYFVTFDHLTPDSSLLSPR